MFSTIIVTAIWIAFAVAIARRARLRNRSAWAWFWCSILLSPFVAILLLLILPPREEPPLWVNVEVIEARKRQGALAFCLSVGFLLAIFVLAML